MNREQTVEKMKRQLDKWNRDIDQLSARADQYVDHAHQEYTDTLKDLRIKRENARADLERLRNASDAAFEDMRAGLEKGWGAVSASFEKAVARYH